MSFKNLFLASAAATLIAGSAMATEPVVLTDAEMDAVAGGANISLLGGAGVVGPLAVLNATSFSTLSQGETSQSNQTIIQPTSVQSLRQVSSIAVNQTTGTSLSNSGFVFSAGALALSADLSLAFP
jgi:hypothetical protein